MPKGMLLKSYPWATNLSDPNSEFTVKHFYGENGLDLHDTLEPLPLGLFISYGDAFQKRFVPSVERKLLVALESATKGFRATFDDGEVVHARRVVIATGIAAFKYLPPVARGIPPEFVSHSADYGPFDALIGKEVAVVGSGSSATDLATLLHEAGASVSLVAHGPQLSFASLPRLRGPIERAIAPTSGIGIGWTMRVCAVAPWLVHMLPENRRVQLAYPKALGPLGGAFMKNRIVGRVSVVLGAEPREIDLSGGKVHLTLGSMESPRKPLKLDHVVFATGYRVDVARLRFLAPAIIEHIALVGTAPRLSRHYESSVPGLHFIGPAAANSFGPVCRFVYGTYHPARHLARYLTGTLRNRLAPGLRAHPIHSPVLQ